MCQKLGLPEKITVRFVRVRLSTGEIEVLVTSLLDEKRYTSFVRVRLSTGEIEVLVTSLLDEKRYTAQMFKELYNLRWGVEGFYGVIKERVNFF